MLKPGDKAPDFSLKSDQDKEVSLADYKGKSDVVLYFYPKDNTSGCTTEACSFRDNIQPIEAKNAVVLGVSPDSIKSHQNFINKQSLNFTLLSDPDHAVAEAYGAWGEKKMYGKSYMGILRSTFIIGKDGIIKHVFDKVKVATHADDVLAEL
ncbi:thioredoxin-dependent thiol peroxidase [candidate division KSB1 bacterium]|nr:thioredoxin-dependent thiol peroxidase [candidate division KSB1 bacterium]